ncbi:porin [Acerihabitans arboris]|uniref:Porin OmpC n=1 Tax=Acerihabitans arboris TaxID=2691583 RepID=A0A845SNG0_9GAMM|nr:porin [Acerihabitans arboris]NDL64078.1 porin OmpC [Acerihabitans arboris]
MKKIALAVLATLITPALHAAEIYNKDGNKLDLYGSMRARHYFSDNKTIDGDASYVRFGFKGQTQINDVLTGYGQWEYNIQANHSEGGTDALSGTKTRLGFAGLKLKDYGSIDYGRNWGIAYDVAAITDTAPIFDDLTYSAADVFMTGRTTGVATYRNNNFFGLVDGLKFGLQYQGANDENSGNARAANKSNGDGYGASASYTFDFGLSVLGTYASSNRTQPQNSLTLGNGDKADVWAGGVKYDNAGIYAAALYGQTHNLTPITGGYANKTENVEAIASYLFDFGLKPMFGYFQSKASDVEGIGDVDLVKYYDASLTYFFNKNMNAYVDYKINRLSDDNKLGIANDDQVGLGLTYQF